MKASLNVKQWMSSSKRYFRIFAIILQLFFDHVVLLPIWYCFLFTFKLNNRFKNIFFVAIRISLEYEHYYQALLTNWHKKRPDFNQHSSNNLRVCFLTTSFSSKPNHYQFKLLICTYVLMECFISVPCHPEVSNTALFLKMPTHDLYMNWKYTVKSSQFNPSKII